MEVEDYIGRAWGAVKGAGVPAELQEFAFREALIFLQGQAGVGAAPNRPGANAAESSKVAVKVRLGDTEGDGEGSSESAQGNDEAWQRLAHESGVAVSDLRDVMQIEDGRVLVTVPNRNLGKSLAEQARATITLVCGMRAFGLGEAPVNAEEVRQELERKRIYQQNNFAATHLGPLKGFNAGANRNQIVVTSKWVGEFESAIRSALGVVEE